MLQVTPHAVPLHVAVPLRTKGHGAQLKPQLLTLVSLAHNSPQRCWPAAQVNPHAVPSHDVVTEPWGAAHGSHDAPQLFTSVFDTQAPLHSCAPVGQVRPHFTPSQAATPGGLAGHGVQLLPHDRTSAFDRQVESQR